MLGKWIFIILVLFQVEAHAILRGAPGIDSPAKNFAVYIEIKDSKNSNLSGYCSGAVISKNLILTAAHCFQLANSSIKNTKKVKIHFTTDIKSGDPYKIINADKYVTHPMFNQSAEIFGHAGFFENDIALVWFKGLPPEYIPVPILSSNDDDLLNQPFSTAGYGQTIDVDDSRNRWYFFGKLMVTNSFFDSTFPQNPYEFETFTSQFSESAPCYGDSGGPAFVTRNGTPIVVGILSSSKNKICRHAKYNFTRVARFSKWISQML